MTLARYRYVYRLKAKDEALSLFKIYIVKIEINLIKRSNILSLIVARSTYI
jgi:hypothetical protein